MELRIENPLAFGSVLIEVAKSAHHYDEPGGVYVCISQENELDDHISVWLSSKEVDTLMVMLAFYQKQPDHRKDGWQLGN